MNEFLVLLCSCGRLLLYLLNCLYLNPQVFAFILLIFSPIPLGGSEGVAVWCLAAYWGSTMTVDCKYT